MKETYTNPNNNITIEIDRSRDELLTDFGKATLNDRYLGLGESYQDLFSRVATYYADNERHAQKLYDYISKLWFMPATPVLSNGGTKRGLPISCFLNEAGDSIDGIQNAWNENVHLASKGGGIGTNWSNIRGIGEKVGDVGKTSGIMPFLKVQDSMTLAISQGSLRRGSAAVYLDIGHPEIIEFIEMRRPTGGDPNRKCLNLHHGVTINNKFMEAVELGLDWELRSPKDKSVQQVINARTLWIRLLTARIETGEPYILFIDNVNRMIPEHHKIAGLLCKTSNLCSEITLPTGIDKDGHNRTAVCCLSSLNLETYDQWKDDEKFIRDVMRFLDNVLTDFINKAPDTFKNAKYSAMRERSVGLGVMGFHSFLQQKNIPWESVMAKVWNQKIFSYIKEEVDSADLFIAEQKGACPDAKEQGFKNRFSNKTAIAPTATISIICGGSSPGIEPNVGNSFAHKTLSGTFHVKNKYLIEVLKKYNEDTQDIWASITTRGGSVSHLEFLSDLEKDVFKTAFEIDQRWLLEFAADRTQLIDQAQSLNLFLPADIDKKMLHKLHFDAWKMGIKSLYYARSRSIQRAEDVNNNKYSTTKIDSNIYKSTDEECLSCQ
jgi:ribonucleoside-diphosphate reductase alpha chain